MLLFFKTLPLALLSPALAYLGEEQMSTVEIGHRCY